MNSTESEIIERQEGRVVLLDADEAILLIEVAPAGAAPFWLTPGGAIEPGETAREAAARELHEETGITVTPADMLGPVWRREHRFEWDGVVIHQQQEFGWQACRIGVLGMNQRFGHHTAPARRPPCARESAVRCLGGLRRDDRGDGREYGWVEVWRNLWAGLARRPVFR